MLIGHLAYQQDPIIGGGQTGSTHEAMSLSLSSVHVATCGFAGLASLMAGRS
jgi:hypothetical protein